MSQILMADGPLIDLNHPRGIRLDRCAQTLARMCRYGGNIPHTSEIALYSVAQHSVLVSRLVEHWGFSAQEQAAGLLHDIHEALMGDVTTPVKRWIGGDINSKENRLSSEVLRLLWEGDLNPHSNAVKFADISALILEVELLGIPEDVFFKTGHPPIPYELPSSEVVQASWGLLVPNDKLTLRQYIQADVDRFLERFHHLHGAVKPSRPEVEVREEQLPLFTGDAA